LDDVRFLKPVSFVTTNIDDLLVDSKKFKNNQFRFTNQCAPQDLRDDKIFCLHGNREKNIFNSHDVETLYENAHYRCFLNNLFGSYCVLFLGFSFRDRRLLDCAALNPDFSRENHKYAGHFALLPSDQDTVSDYELRMHYGIQVFRYDNTDGSHKNFVSSISSWRTVSGMGL
jgi:UDP-2,3-diacylglucosamine pyrophosphatase LpxH